MGQTSGQAFKVTIAGTEMGFAPRLGRLSQSVSQLRDDPPTRAHAGLAYVYYARREDGAVKIGSSIHLPTRLGDIARVHGPLLLLATHRGWFAEETALHDWFRPVRWKPQGEWYRPALVLLRHIARVREEHEVVSFPKAVLPPVVDLREIRQEIASLDHGKPQGRPVSSQGLLW